MKIYEFIINENDSELGMKAISLVDSPAIESGYVSFNKQEKPQFIKFADKKKRIVCGLALIPDKLIYRIDEETGDEYMGYFSAETIETIMSKFMLEATQGTTQDVNFQHDSEDKANAHLIESYILRNEDLVTAVKNMGIEEATIGSWFVGYKFDDDDSYDKAVSGEFTGFSVEVMLQRKLKLNNKNNTNKKTIMGKINKIIDKFKAVLQEFETVELEDVVTADGTMTLRYSEVGTPVLVVSVDEAGVETTEAAAQGEYVIESGQTVVVDESGNLVEVKDAVDVPESVPQDKLAVETPVEAAEVPVETPVEVEMPSDLDKTLRSLIPLDKNGDYSIYVSVYDGELKYGSMSSWTEIKMKAELDLKDAEIVALKAQLEVPVAKPAFTEFTAVPTATKTKAEIAKMSNLEAVKYRLGLKA
jgi:hypothetical protein